MAAVAEEPVATEPVAEVITETAEAVQAADVTEPTTESKPSPE